MHIPEVSRISATDVVVDVPHGQSETHYIGAIWIEDTDGQALAFAELSHATATAPQSSTFQLAANVHSVVPRSWCNKHGLWRGLPVAVPGKYRVAADALPQLCPGPCGAGTPDYFTAQNEGPWGGQGRFAAPLTHCRQAMLLLFELVSLQ